jgi:4'-phosphopantetheinyl transferase
MPIEEIHVWQVRLTDTVMFADEFWQVLDGEEKQTALRLWSETGQTRSVVSRGFLRMILGWYLSMDPASIKFLYGTTGKPYLGIGHGLEFNVTHSDDLFLYTFTRGCQIGIDVEHVSEFPELHDTACCFFSPREQDLLTGLPASDQKQTFFRLWTLREAYVKMRGDGLTDEMNNMDMLSVLKEKDNCAFETFAPLPDYVAAVVVEGSRRRLIRFNSFHGVAS